MPMWRVASTEELELALLPEQYDDHDPFVKREPRMTPNCSFAFKHGCLGSCRGYIPGYALDDSRAAAYIYDDGSETSPVDAYSGLRSLLSRALRDGEPCSIAFSGDSVIHDHWSATIAGAIRLGYQVARCVCSAGTLKWHSLEARNEGAPFCPSIDSEPGECYAILNVSQVTSAAAIGATTHKRVKAPGDCPTLTIRYHQIVPAKHLAALPRSHRRMMPPKQVLTLSSIVIHHAGLLHCNSGE